MVNIGSVHDREYRQKAFMDKEAVKSLEASHEQIQQVILFTLMKETLRH
jgi:hypothetical protein